MEEQFSKTAVVAKTIEELSINKKVIHMDTKEINLNAFERFMRSHVQHYDEEKYWSRRQKIVATEQGQHCFRKIIQAYRLFYIKRCDAFNQASMGTHIGYGAKFETPPKLPHGLYGIIVSHNAVIGSNCTIFHQVTIGEGKGGAPTIGDNVLIGAGAKIIGNVTVGSNSKIGVNAVVVHDVPENSIVTAPEGIVHT